MVNTLNITHYTLHKRLFREAKKYMPGGVNSPVRSFKSVGGSPVFIRRGKGAKIYSEDGRKFIDYCLSWGALILGHTHPEVVTAVKKAVSQGFAFGTATKSEIELARTIREAIPSMEMVRLTNSGTEAVMGAVRAARAFTGRNKILRFLGAYHGNADYLLDCRGIPLDYKKHTLVRPYNDIKRAQEIVRTYKKDIAAIIVEPVAANMGVVLPREGFLEGLRDVCHKYGIVLIFDEVITGFRISYRGAQDCFKVKPDITCLGKIIGGGLPCGAYGGRYEIMKLVAPEGDVYQAGTFSGNPLTVNAGVATLKILKETQPYLRLKKKSEALCRGIIERAKACNIKLKVNYIGSMFSIFFSDKETYDYQSARYQDGRLFSRFFHFLLNNGVYLSPSGLESNFLSVAHTDADINNTLKVIEKAFLCGFHLRGGKGLRWQ